MSALDHEQRRNLQARQRQLHQGFVTGTFRAERKQTGRRASVGGYARTERIFLNGTRTFTPTASAAITLSANEESRCTLRFST